MLIDDFLPAYDVVEHHETLVRAPTEQVYDAVRRMDLSGSALVRGLFWLRGRPALFSQRSGQREGLGLTLEGLLRNGFVLLGESPPHEFLLGLVGQFWTPSGNLRRIAPAEFLDFCEAGYAKAAWNFLLVPRGVGETRLSTETRVLCPDDVSRRRFKRYWSVIGPFSGLIRREMLQAIKKQVHRLDDVGEVFA
jgi:hypothetical protein